MTALARPPTSERGSVRPELLTIGRGLPGWSTLAEDTDEDVPALRWPTALDTYRRMLTDPQVWSLVQAVALPVQRYRLEIDPATLDAGLVELLADDLDLPVLGVERVSDGRSPERFDHRRHLARTLSALNVGHAVFEHAGEIDERGHWRLTDLAPRPAKTLTAWHTDRQGRLLWIEQGWGPRPVRLDAGRLAVWTWQGEPGDPRGQSMLRPLYRPYVARDRLARLDMVAHERNSMGIPVGWVDAGNSAAERDEMERLLAKVAAGEDVNVTLAAGQDFRLRGVEGQTSNVVRSIELHSEEMTRAMLAMIVQAGSTQHGSRALGETQLGLLRMFHDAVLTWYCDVLTQQVIARWVGWNAGTDAPVPRVVWARREEDEPQTAGTRAGGPEPVAASGRREQRPEQTARARRPVAAAATADGRRLRRELYSHEITAAIDVDAMEVEWVQSRDSLAALLADVRVQLGSAAVAAIEDLDPIEPATLGVLLARLLADHEVDTSAIEAALREAARRGTVQVVGEAARQGVALDIDGPDYGPRAQAEAAGLVGRLARQVADSAQTAAVTRAGPGADAATIARAVADHLDSLTDAGPEQAAAGATSRATHAGRTHALDQVPYERLYASALLDQNACGPCIEWDGREFTTLAEAQAQFPAGGNADCEGGERCRCSIVGVLATEQEVAT